MRLDKDKVWMIVMHMKHYISVDVFHLASGTKTRTNTGNTYES